MSIKSLFSAIAPVVQLNGHTIEWEDDNPDFTNYEGFVCNQCQNWLLRQDSQGFTQLFDVSINPCGCKGDERWPLYDIKWTQEDADILLEGSSYKTLKRSGGYMELKLK